MARRNKRNRSSTSSTPVAKRPTVSSPRFPPLVGIYVDFPNHRGAYRTFATLEGAAVYVQAFVTDDDYEVKGADKLMTSDGARIRLTGPGASSLTQLLDIEEPEDANASRLAEQDMRIIHQSDAWTSVADRREAKEAGETPTPIGREPKQKRLEGAITVGQLAQELGVEPSHARAALRKQLKPRPAKWEWLPNDETLPKVRDIIKGAKK